MEKKVVIITGASRGIGRAIAESLLDYQVVLASRNETAILNLASGIKKQGGDAFPVRCDVTVESNVTMCIEKTLDRYGRIDVLINNAGIGAFKRVDEFTPEEFLEIQKVNVYGTFLFTKHVTPHLIAQKKGQIINIASVAGLNGFKTGTAYAASKFAVVGFTESLREDLKEFGIAVTALCPGSVLTDFGEDHQHDKSDSEFILMPEDVARTVKYLIEESETANAKMIELKPRRRREYR
ncbi:MAG: SDR family oxidoreductase [Leptospirales bacterium]